MKVLMTADTVGGVWTYATDLIRALQPLGVEVALAAMGGPAPDTPGIYHRNFKLEWMDDPWDDVRAAGDWLLDLEAQLTPDVIHLNGYAHGALPWRAPVLMVAHSDVLSWWQAVHNEPAPPAWDRYRDAISLGLSGARLLVTPTQAMLNSLDRYACGGQALACAGLQSRVISNSRLLRVRAAATPAPYILSAGRLWDEAKNVRALAAVAGRIPWPICVAGETGGQDLGALKPLGRLTMHQLLPWYANASIYALPARYEPFGLSVLEAAMASCALVLGDIPSLRENWDGAAVFVPPNDIDALATALVDLIHSPGLRACLQRSARVRSKRFSPARMARQYLEAYRACAS